MSFTQVNKGGRSFFSHPGAANARGGFLGVDSNNMSIRSVPFTVRGSENPAAIELETILTSDILKVTGAPMAPITELVDGTKIYYNDNGPNGFFDTQPTLQAVHEVPTSLL